MSGHVGELLKLIDDFLEERCQSMNHVSEIEGLIIERFQDSRWFDDVSEQLSLFLPGGTGYYVDEKQLVRTLSQLAVTLRREFDREGDTK